MKNMVLLPEEQLDSQDFNYTSKHFTGPIKVTGCRDDRVAFLSSTELSLAALGEEFNARLRVEGEPAGPETSK